MNLVQQNFATMPSYEKQFRLISKQQERKEKFLKKKTHCVQRGARKEKGTGRQEG
jgi:hypothetical protein